MGTGCLRDRLAAQGASPATMRAYLAVERAWLAAAGGDPAAWTQDQAWELLSDPAWSARTRAAYRVRLRAVLHHHGRADLAEALPRVRVPRGVPRPAPAELVAQGLAADPATAAMVALAALAGLRRAELAGLRRADVDTRGLRVTGKGGHTRAVPLHPVAAQLLGAWLRAAPPSPWVFPSPRGGHLAGHTVYLRIRAAVPGLAPHELRHYFGTELYRGTHDLLQTQQALGHASPATTAGYALVDSDSLRAAVCAVPAPSIVGVSPGHARGVEGDPRAEQDRAQDHRREPQLSLPAARHQEHRRGEAHRRAEQQGPPRGVGEQLAH